ncbi:MAG: hypothetical protein ACI4ME_01890 [Aristaeellaceae bacterium]
MKKTVCLMLAMMLCLASVPALAAGKLNVTQENYHFVVSYGRYVYAYAKVENSGDRPIKVNAGVLEIYDENGDVLSSTDYHNAYATYLQPGEYTYVRMYDGLEENQVPADYMLTLVGKSDNSRVAFRLPAEASFEMGVKEEWQTHNYLYAQVTNPTDKVLYSVETVFALLDAEENIIYIESKSLYSEIGIMPGQSVMVRLDIPTNYTDYFAANGIVPASVDAISYVLMEK